MAKQTLGNVLSDSDSLHMVALILIGTMLYLPVQEIDEGQEEEDVDEREEDDGEDHLVSMHGTGETVLGFQHIVDDPGLATQLGREPTRLHADLGC